MKKIKLKNGQELIIRKAVKDDASNMIEYINTIAGESAFLTFGPGEFEITIEKEESIIESLNAGDNSIMLVAIVDNKIVGNLLFCGGKRSRTRHTGEFGVSVLKEYWGNGIGRELISYLIAWAKESNVVTKINLRARSDNKRAIELYKELGFKEDGIITRDFYIDGKYYDSLMMGLEIN